MEKFGGFFKDGGGFDFEFFWGSIPKNPQKMGMGTGIEPLKGLGILWGRGRLKLWGFFRGKSPKNLKKRGWDGGRILGDFAQPTLHSKADCRRGDGGDRQFCRACIEAWKNGRTKGQGCQCLAGA